MTCALRLTYSPSEEYMANPTPDHIDEVLADQLWSDLEVGLAYVGIEGKWLRVNPFLCELLEYSDHELRSRTFQSVTHPDDVNDDVEMLEQVIRGKLNTYTMSKRYITKTGRVIWMKLKVTAVRNEDGSAAFFLSQILPKNHAELKHAVSGQVSEPSSITRFVKREWKWVAGGAVSLIVFTAGALVTAGVVVSQWDQMRTDVKNISTTVSDLQQRVGGLETRERQ